MQVQELKNLQRKPLEKQLKQGRGLMQEGEREELHQGLKEGNAQKEKRLEGHLGREKADRHLTA